jgi:hypothetical protein
MEVKPVRSYRAYVFGAIFVMAATISSGQQTGEITGTVTDATGAVMPDVTVIATNTATQVSRNTTSSQSGNYTIPYLNPGTYTVKAQKPGFKNYESSVTLNVAQNLRVDFRMDVGEINQRVEVTSSTPLLNTESAAVQSNVEGKQIVALPLNGRDYLSLVALNPNVVSEQGVVTSQVGLAGTRAASLISIAGQRLEWNHYTLDGVENTEPNYNTYIIHPSVDALQEFTVMTGIYSAEFGKGSGQINATTLPGGNAYHGTAYDFMRNGFVDARIWRQTGPKNPFHRQDYGFVLDGPVRIPRLFNGRDKLFFASSFEALRDNQVLQQLDTVPTANMRSGNFSGNIPGELPIYWPQSQVFSGTKGACQISSGGSYNPTTKVCTISGTLNVIPPSLMSPIAKTLTDLLPLPNQAGGPTEETLLAQNYIAQIPQITDSTQFNQRIDWSQGPRSNIFARYSWQDDLSIPVSSFGEISQSETNTLVRQAVIGHTFTINPHMVNDLRASWSHFYNSTAGAYANGTFNPQASLGIQGLYAVSPQTYGYPSIAFGSGISGYGGINPYFTTDNIYQYGDNLAIIKGKQTFKVGGFFEADQFNELGNQFATGALSFNGNATLNPAKGNNTISGMGLADAELGIVTGQYLRISALSNVELRRKAYAAFLEDDYKLRQNITLNLGIRYDNIRPWYDNHNNFWGAQIFTTGVNVGTAPRYTQPPATLIPNAPSPIYTRPGPTGCNFYANATLQFAEPGQPVQCGNQYMGRSLKDPNNKDFGPRVGLAWALGAKTSIRAGFGIFYVIDTGEDEFNMGRNMGGKDGTTTVPTGAPYIPLSAPWSLQTANASCSANQYNGGVNWTGPCVSAPQFMGTEQHNRTPYVEQYIFNVQRQITNNVALEVGYTGNQSHHVNRYFIFNQAVPRTGPTDTSSVVSRRPWPAIGNMQIMSDWDRGAYNAMGVKLTQHISHGLLYVVSFTWGHSIDFGSAVRGNSGDTLWPANSYDLQHERGNSQFNQPRRLVASYNYDLPFGKGKEFAPDNTIVNHVVSGWSWGGILTLADGTSQSVSSVSGDPSGLGVLSTWPQWQGTTQYRNSHPTPFGGVNSRNGYWNLDAFQHAYDLTGYPNQSWQQGNWSRGNLYTPGLLTFDTNISRTFHIWESHALLIRVEAFNATNHVNWCTTCSTATSTVPTSASFGTITTTTTHMRELQGALKYSF